MSMIAVGAVFSAPHVSATDSLLSGLARPTNHASPRDLLQVSFLAVYDPVDLRMVGWDDGLSGLCAMVIENLFAKTGIVDNEVAVNSD